MSFAAFYKMHEKVQADRRRNRSQTFDKRYRGNSTLKNYSKLIEDTELSSELLEEDNILKTLAKASLATMLLLPPAAAEPKTPPANVAVRAVPVANNDAARVIFAETGPVSSPMERLLVASVLKNRISHKGFGRGRLKTMSQVALDKGQFESVEHNKNKNWKLSGTPGKMNRQERAAWNQSVLLSKGGFTPQEDIVYFHDNSLSEPPKSWNNKYWGVTQVTKTKNFTFYTIYPKKKK